MHHPHGVLRARVAIGGVEADIIQRLVEPAVFQRAEAALIVIRAGPAGHAGSKAEKQRTSGDQRDDGSGGEGHVNFHHVI